MSATLMRVSAALILAAGIGPAAAEVEPDSEPRPVPVKAAIGVKTGVIPPVLAVPELMLHLPHFFAGAFGIFTGGGLGNGGRRTTLGGEVGFEFNPPELSTPYLSGSYFRYEASANAAGFSESSDLLTLTAGYEWKLKHFELQLGAGALFVLRDDVPPPPPCSGFCLDFSGFGPKVLPTFELAARYRF